MRRLFYAIVSCITAFSFQAPKLIGDILSVDYGISYFVKADGSLWTMGWSGPEGELDGGIISDRTSPVQLASDVYQVAGTSSSCSFIKTDGTLWLLGDWNTNTYHFPVEVAANVSHIAPYGGNLFIKTDGTLWGMGGNVYGQLGDGTTTYRDSPVQLVSGVLSAAAGVVIASSFNSQYLALNPLDAF